MYQFLASKNVKSYNHLISGAPTSQILSYLANHKMFDEMQAISDENNVIMTVYVDDVTFSSEYYIIVARLSRQNFRGKIMNHK